MRQTKKFHFHSSQKHHHGGKKTIHRVSVKNNKGHKKVSYYQGSKLVHSVKKSLKPLEVEMIKIGKFIPGLFKDCPCNKTKKHRKH